MWSVLHVTGFIWGSSTISAYSQCTLLSPQQPKIKNLSCLNLLCWERTFKICLKLLSFALQVLQFCLSSFDVSSVKYWTFLQGASEDFFLGASDSFLLRIFFILWSFLFIKLFSKSKASRNSDIPCTLKMLGGSKIVMSFSHFLMPASNCSFSTDRV